MINAGDATASASPGRVSASVVDEDAVPDVPVTVMEAPETAEPLPSLRKTSRPRLKLLSMLRGSTVTPAGSPATVTSTTPAKPVGLITVKTADAVPPGGRVTTGLTSRLN